MVDRSATLVPALSLGLLLAACSSPQESAPADQARAALHAKYGPGSDIAVMAVKEVGDRRVICGLTTPDDMREPFAPLRFAVVDGQAIPADEASASDELVKACLAELPASPHSQSPVVY
jgi:hypothetical protein